MKPAKEQSACHRRQYIRRTMQSSWTNFLIPAIPGKKSYAVKIKKPLQQVLTDDSPHLKFWIEARKKLMDMRYVKLKCKTPLSNSPSLNGWIEYLKTLPVVWQMLKERGFTFMKTGYINQDSLENFFGFVKSRGVRYVSPSCHQTEGIYKALLVRS